MRHTAGRLRWLRTSFACADYYGNGDGSPENWTSPASSGWPRTTRAANTIGACVAASGAPASVIGGEDPKLPTRSRGDRSRGEVVEATRRTHLASERTCLAWWRTGLTSLTVGIGARAATSRVRTTARSR